MAWRSSGTTNDEMVNNMKRFGVIQSEAVEAAFRAVDRQHFVPQNRRDLAHSDQPLKEGNIHISAPHIYGSVLEALELGPATGQSFLNLGAGTGYLSCLVSHVLGARSRHVGVEVYADVVQHCRDSMQRYYGANNGVPNCIEILHGNALEIDGATGEALVGFDRIYVGASLSRAQLSRIANLLKPGGVFVGPVDDELIKVMRIGNATDEATSSTPAPIVSSRRRGSPSTLRAPHLSSDFTQHVVSSVRFAPLMTTPSIPTKIVSKVWDPSIHNLYPDSFRESAKAVLLCARSPATQPPPPPPVLMQHRVNVAGQLPRALWMEVLSFTHRDWFDPPHSNEEFLRRRLVETQAAAEQAREAHLEAEMRLHMAERERDVYRLLAMRWQARMQAVLTGEEDVQDMDVEENLIDMDDIAEAAASLFGDDPSALRLSSLSAVIRRFQRRQALADARRRQQRQQEESEDNDDDSDAMEDSEMEDAEESEAPDEENETLGVAAAEPPAVVSQPMALSQHGVADSESGLPARQQPRTVSIGEDL